MKRLASLVLASSLTLGSILSMDRAAMATPFSDVPANHWAYQYIQSLAADGIIDGYPDGKFKGDRPLTRYEMAVVVARVIAKLQENQSGVTRADLDKLQKLIDALKDELDELGVRVTNLEDSLDALDKRTKFAQSLSMHGVLLPNATFRQRTTIPRSITNTTGASQATYYGQTIANGRTGSIDPFVNQFLTSDDSNNPLTQAGSGIQIRQDDRFSLAYAVSDGLTVSFPIRILNFEYGGDFSQNANVDIEPSIDINLASLGAVSNLHFRFGVIDNQPSSRLGLTYRPPFGTSNYVSYEYPLQPYQKGISASGTLGEGNFGSLDMFASFTRIDPTLLDTQTGVLNPNNGNVGAISTLFPVVAPQYGYTVSSANGTPGTLRTDTFNAGTGTLASVYLGAKAIIGTVYISGYNGGTYTNAGVNTGTTGPAAPPAFTYNDAYNLVVFSAPLPAGSVVKISYEAEAATGNTNWQRYDVNARLNQKFKFYPGGEIGLEYNRIFDFADTTTTGDFSTVFQSAAQGLGLVSDTVFGVDGQAPLPFFGPKFTPTLFGEFASSKFTPDVNNVSAIGDTAYVAGIKFAIGKANLTGQYQSVGTNYLDGAPYGYYGQTPPIFQYYHGAYFPDFFGLANNLAANSQFDNAFTNIGAANPHTAGNPALTYLQPIWDPFRGNGPTFFSAFTPNSRGETISGTLPFNVAGIDFASRAQYQHLEEITPNSFGNLQYGLQYPTSTPEKNDVYTVGFQFGLPIFSTNKLNLNLAGTYETLQRLDSTAHAYYPFNPNANIQGNDPTSVAAAAAAFGPGGSPVSFYPNYVNVRRIAVSVAGSLPLSKQWTLNGSYSTQRYGGEYQTTLNQNISEHKDYYQGNLSYAIPKTNSAISFQARTYKYSDDVLPNYDYTENREDVFFTIRF